MKFSESAKDSAIYLRKAIPLMVERDIPPTPYNYSLWYVHAKQDNPELSRELLEQFPAKGSYDYKKSEALFFDYFIKHHLPKDPGAQNALAGLLTQLFGAVNQIEDGTRDYGDSLQNSMSLLDNTSDQQEIQSILAKLLEDTSAVEDASKAFTGELEKAKAEIEELKAQLHVSRKDALLDQLTKIGNRRAFDQAINDALANLESPTCLILLDLDHFKQCNDTYGHVMGDKVLERVGQILKGKQAEGVLPMRYGGEEFAVIFDGDEAQAVELAEEIRLAVSGTRIQQKETGKPIGSITVSIGIARAEAGEDAKTLKIRADEALYEAKGQGRNRVICGSASIIEKAIRQPAI